MIFIKAIRCNPDGAIHYKLNHSDEWQILPQRKNITAKACPVNKIPLEYHERFKIKKEKWDQLQNLKSGLDLEHHHFLDSLPHD